MKNNIEKILRKKNMSIRKLSKLANLDYAATYRLVKRIDLSNTQINTLANIAKALNVDVNKLYGEE